MIEELYAAARMHDARAAILTGKLSALPPPGGAAGIDGWNRPSAD